MKGDRYQLEQQVVQVAMFTGPFDELRFVCEIIGKCPIEVGVRVARFASWRRRRLVLV